MNDIKDVYFYSVTYGPMLLHKWNDAPWLFTTGPDGHRWVSLRKATDTDLAELVQMRGLIRGITPCEIRDCTRSGFPCYDEGNINNVPDEWLCKQHQTMDGFCVYCGHLWCIAASEPHGIRCYNPEPNQKKER